MTEDEVRAAYDALNEALCAAKLPGEHALHGTKFFFASESGSHTACISGKILSAEYTDGELNLFVDVPLFRDDRLEFLSYQDGVWYAVHRSRFDLTRPDEYTRGELRLTLQL